MACVPNSTNSVAGAPIIQKKDIEGLSESILNGVDYDLYKGDLEERILLGCIEEEVIALLSSYGIFVLDK